MELLNLYRWFNRRARAYECRIFNIYTKRDSYDAWEYRYLTETLLSEIWQTWCLFSRVLLLKSLRGCRARNGDFIIGRVGENSWERVCYEAVNFIKNRKITDEGHKNFKMKYELTWGDVDVFIKAVNYFSPSNKSALLSSYGLPFEGVKHIQKVRNSCAHKNIENMNELARLSTYYDFYRLSSPIDIVWTLKRGGNLLAIESWIDELNIIAKNATVSL